MSKTDIRHPLVKQYDDVIENFDCFLDVAMTEFDVQDNSTEGLSQLAEVTKEAAARLISSMDTILNKLKQERAA